MSVYVDNARIPFGRMLMCHMWADTVDELHDMASALKLKRQWFQCPPSATWAHYDICQAKRAEAIQRGAVETDRYGPLEFIARQREQIKLLHKIAEIRCRKR